jgi:hypothetical protein
MVMRTPGLRLQALAELGHAIATVATAKSTASAITAATGISVAA